MTRSAEHKPRVQAVQSLTPAMGAEGHDGVRGLQEFFSPGRIGWVLLGLVGLVLAALVWRYAAYAGSLLSYPYEWDDDEGVAVYFAKRLVERQPIYGDLNKLPMLSAAYPPVYHFLLAPLVAWLGPTLLAGRLLSMAASVVTLLLIAVAVRQRTRHWGLAALAAILIIGSPASAVWGPLCRVDTLAVMLLLAGIVVVEQFPRWRAALPAGLLLLLAACYTKYQVAPLALVAFWQIGRHNRKLAAGAAAAFAAAGLVVLLVLTLWSGGHFWASTVTAQACQLRLLYLRDMVTGFLEKHWLLVAAATGWVYYRVRLRQLDVWSVMALVSIPVLLPAAKTGASTNYFLAPVAVAAVCTALGVQELRRRWSGPWQAGLGGMVALLIALQATTFLLNPLRWPTAADRQICERIVSGLRKIPRDVLTERRVMFSLLSGSQPQADTSLLYFTYFIGRDESGRKIGATCWDPKELIRALDERRYPVLLLSSNMTPPDIAEAISRNYHQIGEPMPIANWQSYAMYRTLVPKPPESRR